MNLARIDRQYVELEVTATERDGQAATLTGVDIALLAPRSSPTADTAWTVADYTNGVATVLLAGPDADATDALPVPREGADLWIRVVDDPETLTAHVERISIS